MNPLLAFLFAVTAHGDTLSYAGALPGAHCHAFELLVRDSVVWEPRSMVTLEFPHSMSFAYQQRVYRVDGTTQPLGTVIDTTRRTVLGDPVSLPAAALASRAREDGRRAVLVFATFRGAFSADSLLRVSIGTLQSGGIIP